MADLADQNPLDVATTDIETTDTELSEASTEEPRRGIGCGAFLAAVLFGMVLTVAQESVLSRTWTSCEWGYGPPGDSFPDDGAYLDIFAIVLRLPAYVVASLIGAYVGRRWISRAGWAGAVLRILTIVAVCAVVFVGDFAWGVKMNAGDYNPAHCPGGVPTWWPF